MLFLFSSVFVGLVGIQTEARVDGLHGRHDVGEDAFLVLTEVLVFDFTDIDNWNDTGVIILEKAPGLPTTPLPPA